MCQPSVEQWRDEWQQPELTLPTPQQATDALFESVPLDWSRLADFQDVVLRLIAERLVAGFTQPYDGSPYQQIAYVQCALAAHGRLPTWSTATPSLHAL